MQQILFSMITQKYSEQIRWNFTRTFIRTYEYNNTKTRYILVYKCLKMQCKHEKCDGIYDGQTYRRKSSDLKHALSELWVAMAI